MDKSIELQKKSEYYEGKVNATLNNNSISSDNPEVIDLLKEKLQKLEEKREEIKAYNKEQRKKGGSGADSYYLSNLSQNIRSVKQRIEYLKSKEGEKTITTQIGEIKLVDNVEDNRLQIFFSDIPNVDLRTKLKRNGFRWSRYNGCWQRYRSNWATTVAKEIIKGEK